MSDNFHIDVCSEGNAHFEAAMRIAFEGAPRRAASHYQISEEKGLILYWSASDKAAPLPYAMNCEAATQFAWNWLATASYGHQPDHDGSNKKGWRVYNEAWSRIGNDWKAFVAIQPCWMMYGK